MSPLATAKLTDELPEILSGGRAFCNDLAAFYASCNWNNDAVRAAHHLLLDIERNLQQLENVITEGTSGDNTDIQRYTEAKVESCRVMLDRMIMTHTEGRPSRLDQSDQDVSTKFRILTFEIRQGNTENIFWTLHTIRWGIGVERFQRAIHLARMGSALDVARNAQMTNHRQTILTWLNPPDPLQVHNFALKEKQAETGAWFLDKREFADWRNSPGQIIWIHGSPECGKTVLCSTIIEAIRDNYPPDSGTVISFFYFDSNDPEKRRYDAFLASLIAQLSAQASAIPEVLEDLYCSCAKGSRTPSTKILERTFKALVKIFQRVYILVDGLDECSQRSQLLALITEISAWKVRKPHILVTSRKESDIAEALIPIVKAKLGLRAAIANAEIELYIRVQGAEDAREKMVVGLKARARGRFPWAVCQLDMLKSLRTFKSFEDAIESPSVTMSATYNNALERISDSDANAASRVVQWLAYPARPVSVGEVAAAMAVDLANGCQFDKQRLFIDPLDILEICPSLITISDEKSEAAKLRFTHHAVKEHLMGVQRAPGARYSIVESTSHQVIARCCLGYLLHCCKGTFEVEETLQNYPLAGYAARHWPEHVRKCGNRSEEVLELAMSLIYSRKDIFANCCQIYSPDFGIENEHPDTISPDIQPLYYASSFGLLEIFDLLLDRGLDIDAYGGRYGNALHAASANGEADAAKFLLDRAAGLDFETTRKETALHHAARFGHMDVARLLIDRGADVNHVDVERGTPLHNAAKFGQLEIAQLLLDNGVDVNARTLHSYSVFDTAVAADDFEMVELLLDAGAAGNLCDALRIASFLGNHKIVLRLLKEAADVNGLERSRIALKHLMKRRGLETALYLPLGEAPVKAPAHISGSALQCAVMGGNIEMVQLLLDKGANLNARGGEYCGDALQCAAERCDLRILQLLLDKGAEVNASPGRFGTALQAAVSNCCTPITLLLLGKGADVNASGGDYSSPALHCAAIHGDLEMISLLLHEGADIDAHGSCCLGTALQAAAAFCQVDSVNRLLLHGASVDAGVGCFGTAIGTSEEVGRYAGDIPRNVYPLDEEGLGMEDRLDRQRRRYVSVEDIARAFDEAVNRRITSILVRGKADDGGV